MPGGPQPPLSVIETWPKPNYVDPFSQGNALPISCIVFPAIGFALVTARVYSRLFITKAPGFDDVLIIVAAAFGTALAVLVTIADRTFHIDRHIWDVPIVTASGGRLNIWIAEWCYLTACCCVKVSILLFYRRLSVSFSKAFLIAVWCGIVYNVCYMLSFMLILLLQCRPLSAYWLAFDQQWAETHQFSCRSSEHISLPLSGVFSVIGDFYSTMIPLCLVYFLDLPTRQKKALYGLFALGFLVVGAGIERTILLNTVINETYDYTLPLYKMWIWTFVELYVAIFAASAPALKPFFRKFFIEPITNPSSGSRRYGGRYGDRYVSRPRSLDYNTYTSEKDLRAAPANGSGKGATVWGEDTSTARGSTVLNGEMDIEKIGVAVSRGAAVAEEEVEMEQYRYKRWDGRDKGTDTLRPLRRQTSLDLQSEGGGISRQPSQSHTFSSTDWILPPVQIHDDSLRSYRAEIETLPPIPSQSARTVKRSTSMEQRRHTPRQCHVRRPSTAMSGSTIFCASTANAANSQPRYSAGLNQNPYHGSSPLHVERHPSQSSLRAQQVRARQVQVTGVGEASRELDDGINYSVLDPPVVAVSSPHSQRANSRLDLDSDMSDYDDEPPRQQRKSDTSTDRKTWNTNTLRESSKAPSAEDSDGEMGRRSSSIHTLQFPRRERDVRGDGAGVGGLCV